MRLNRLSITERFKLLPVPQLIRSISADHVVALRNESQKFFLIPEDLCRIIVSLSCLPLNNFLIGSVFFPF